MKYFQQITATLLLCSLSITLGFGQSKTLLDKVIGQVGGEFILLSEIEQQYHYYKENFPQEVHPINTRCEILENIMAQNLLVNQAKLDSVIVSWEEVDMQIEARVERIVQQMGGDISAFEEFYGMTIDQVKADQRQPLRNQLLAERMQMQVTANVRATPSEVVDFFNSIPRDSLPFYNSEVQIAELVMFPEANQETREQTLNRITEFRNQIISGQRSFEEIARTFSDDVGSGRQGGNLGWQRRGTFVAEFEATVFNLEPGEISDPIETEFGFHIIELLERRGNNINARHILLTPRVSTEDRELTRNHLDSIRTMIIRDSIPFDQAVRIFGSDKAQSYHNGGRVVNNMTGNTFFEVGELEPDVYFAIIDLQVGEISEVIEFTDRSGDRKYKIFELISRTRPHRANLQQDYAKIRELATEYKRAQKFNKWLMNRLSDTYINVHKMYHECPNIEFWLGESKDMAEFEHLPYPMDDGTGLN
ncbi:MAG: peptidylprolyl isomerase [Saprospirales bacterium]|nr:MAG: peptidylprolyl isomerase [Saprospirales bacterium]